MSKNVKDKEKEIIIFDFRTIKTFEDACKKENVDPVIVPDLSVIPEEFRKPLIAVYKLFIIFKAINNGWIPDWNNTDQYKYFPWFRVLSSGFGFSASGCGYGNAYTSVGSRLCFETKEQSDYAATRFIDIYEQFLTIKK